MERRASHAGTWYSAEKQQLSRQLQGWMDNAAKITDLDGSESVCAIIAPHAGYSYSGPTAGHAYCHLRRRVHVQQENAGGPTTVLLLGPSHHLYLENQCAIPQVSSYASPLGSVPVEREALDLLQRSHDDLFVALSRRHDEAEHSLEMHVPYLVSALGGPDQLSLIPVVIGSLSLATAQRVAGALLPLFSQSANTLLVCSSDFCHWGCRFSFDRYDPSHGAIHQSIEALDREGMRIIEDQDPAGFASYLDRTQNTICGRYPILVLLYMLNMASKQHDTHSTIKFVQYTQSSKVTRKSDSSVSYASAIVKIG